MEINVWHTTPEMKDKKIFLHYKMNFETFNNLVLELTPFLQSSCLNHVKPQLEIKRLWLLLFIDLLMDLMFHIWPIDSIWVHQQFKNMLTLFVMC